jgi:hypothetical protein
VVVPTCSNFLAAVVFVDNVIDIVYPLTWSSTDKTKSFMALGLNTVPGIHIYIFSIMTTRIDSLGVPLLYSLDFHVVFRGKVRRILIPWLGIPVWDIERRRFNPPPPEKPHLVYQLPNSLPWQALFVENWT